MFQLTQKKRYIFSLVLGVFFLSFSNSQSSISKFKGHQTFQGADNNICNEYASNELAMWDAQSSEPASAADLQFHFFSPFNGLLRS